MKNFQASYEAFVSDGGTYEQALDALEKRQTGMLTDLADQLATYQFLKTYISLGEEGLVIGSKDSPLKMVLSSPDAATGRKPRLSFMDGGKETAYFEGQSFFINKGAVVDSLQVNTHKLTGINDDVINDDVTVFQWVQ